MTDNDLFDLELKENATLSPKYADKVFGHNHFVEECAFIGINHNEDCLLSLTSIPGESGFHVRMKGVKVTPIHYKSFSNMPNWLYVSLKFLGLKES